MPQVRSILPGNFAEKTPELAEGQCKQCHFGVFGSQYKIFLIAHKTALGRIPHRKLQFQNPGLVYSEMQSLLCEFLRLSTNQESPYIENVCSQRLSLRHLHFSQMRMVMLSTAISFLLAPSLLHWCASLQVVEDLCATLTQSLLMLPDCH